MTTFDWNSKFATDYVDQKGNRIMFNPLHSKTEGSLITRTNGKTIGGSYFIQEQSGDLYLSYRGEEYLIVPTEEGFDLFLSEIKSYIFVRVL